MGMWFLYSLLLSFWSDKVCDIVNITYEHPMKCLLIEKKKKKQKISDFVIVYIKMIS